MRNRHFLALDILGLTLAPFTVLALRFEGWSWPEGWLATVSVFAAIFIPLQLGVAAYAGLYRCLWKHASIAELERILLAGMIAGVLGFIVGVPILEIVPAAPFRMRYSSLALNTMLSLAVLAGPRLWVRFAHARRPNRASGETVRTIVVGAGSAGQLIARESLNSDRARFGVVAFVDDDRRKVGQLLNGIPIAGRIADLPRLIPDLAVTEVIIAIPSARGNVVREVVELARKAGARTRTMPSLADIVSGRVEVTALRPVEIQDLLRRAPITTDLSVVATLAKGRTVMVTGAGGSIGSELARQIADLEPSHLVLLDHSENQIFEIDNELRRRQPNLTIIPVIADIRDSTRIHSVFQKYRPFAVFHAAAHKHVPLMEENLIEAVTNNVLGTRVLVDAALEYEVTHFVLISTDKAVRPTSMMGATKRVAEHIVRRAAAREGRHFVAVRFGNVLGSRGSVVPTFLRQIQAGGPLTVTHPEMRRFFMTIPEAVQLVLQAGASGSGGELFVLDMGDAVKIVDLARDLIRLSGLEEGRDIDLKFVGLRPGEKLYEEVLFGDENIQSTDHPKVIRVLAELPRPEIEVQVDELVRLATMFSEDESRLRESLLRIVPDFIPLDQRMVNTPPEGQKAVMKSRGRKSGESRKSGENRKSGETSA